MGDVVEIEGIPHDLCLPSAPAEDSFLIDEGLGLLAAYRSIPDAATRLKLKALIEAVARSFGRSRS